MKTIKRVGLRAQIDAPADLVWELLTDFRHYARWNPYLVAIAGESRKDACLGVEIESPDGEREQLRARVCAFEGSRTLSWVERPKLLRLRWREYFVRIEAGHRQTSLHHGFNFHGMPRRRGQWIHVVRQVRAGLGLMNETLSRVAAAGSVRAWMDPANPRRSSDYRWTLVHQARVYHQVAKAIEIIRRSPRQVERMSLAGWTCRQSPRGRACIACDGAIPVGYHPDRLPAELHGLHPILVGMLRGRTFVLDGAHRIARHLQAGQTAIPAVRLSEAETAACIREGFERKVEFDSAELVLPQVSQD